MDLNEDNKEKESVQFKEWAPQVDLLEARMETITAHMETKRAKELRFLRARQEGAADTRWNKRKTRQLGALTKRK